MLRKTMLRKQGIPASPGVAIGKVLKLRREVPRADMGFIQAEQVDEEKEKYRRAIETVRGQMKELIERGEPGIEADILNTHLSILEDPYLKNLVYRGINKDFLNVQQALTRAMEQISDRFYALEDEYLKERVNDFQDVYEQILLALKGVHVARLEHLEDGTIVLARSLGPSDTAVMDLEKVRGFVLDLGGRTSHTAIMARNMAIPAVVGCVDLFDQIDDGDTLVLDGKNGEVVVNPSPEALEEYQCRRRLLHREREELDTLHDLPPITRDGKEVQLWANLDNVREIAAVKHSGAGGVGLMRTEFCFIGCKRFPNEEEQFQVYAQVAQSMEGRPVVIRTMDITGEKFLQYYPTLHQENVFLLSRSKEFRREYREIFKAQLRAILRASMLGDVRLMFPMITSLEEMQECRSVLWECHYELAEAEIPFNPDMQLGVMVEAPAAAVLVDRLLPHADFFSIGTDELTQHMLAVDLGDERLQHLYNTFHPAVLTSLQHVIDEVHAAGKTVCVCGELAEEAGAVALLMGMGLDIYSVGASLVPVVKRTVRSTSYAEACGIAKEALDLNSAAEVKRFLNIVEEEQPV